MNNIWKSPISFFLGLLTGFIFSFLIIVTQEILSSTNIYWAFVGGIIGFIISLLKDIIILLKSKYKFYKRLSPYKGTYQIKRKKEEEKYLEYFKIKDIKNNTLIIESKTPLGIVEGQINMNENDLRSGTGFYRTLGNENDLYTGLLNIQIYEDDLLTKILARRSYVEVKVDPVTKKEISFEKVTQFMFYKEV